MMQSRHLIILIILICFHTTAEAQKRRSVEATYTYVAAQHESLEEAKRNAVHYAKIEALRNEFGTLVSDASASTIVQKGNTTTEKFVSMSGEGELNGEWIGDREAPKVETTLDGGKIVVKATVKGYATEIGNNTIDYVAKVLRNQPSPEYESEEFVAGNDIYVSFSAPIDGYLAIYLLDSDNAYCLLPYRANKDGFFKVTHQQEYILFSQRNHAVGENPQEIDEYTVTSDKDLSDFNQIYFIFSPNMFRKPVDFNKPVEEDGLVYPRMMTWGNFQEWIIKARKRDKEMSVKVKNIEVKPQSL